MGSWEGGGNFRKKGQHEENCRTSTLLEGNRKLLSVATASCFKWGWKKVKLKKHSRDKLHSLFQELLKSFIGFTKQRKVRDRLETDKMAQMKSNEGQPVFRCPVVVTEYLE